MRLWRRKEKPHICTPVVREGRKIITIFCDCGRVFGTVLIKDLLK